MRQLIQHHVLIIGLTSFVMFVNLGGTRLWDRDEPRNAGCAAEMLARGDFVVPLFNGQLRTAKPALLYWFIMSAYAVFGINEFAARFWSAIFGVGTVIATYHLGRRLFNAEAGVWGAVILATSLMFNVTSRAATPDATLIFFSTLALLVFARAGFPSFPSRWIAVALMYGLMGIGVLAKGPVGCVLPTAVIGMYLLIFRLRTSCAPSITATTRDTGSVLPIWKLADCAATLIRPFRPLHFLTTLWQMRPLTAVLVILIITLPWYLWVALKTDGEWVRSFLLEENFRRATISMENHRGSPLYYLVAVLAGFFPASVFIGAMTTSAVRDIRNQHRWLNGYIFLFSWVGVYVCLFTMVQTKLPHYVTPTHPALALLAGCFFYNWTRGKIELSLFRGRIILGCLGVTGLAFSVGIHFASWRYLPGETWLWTTGLILVAGSLLCMLFLQFGYRRAVAATFIATGMVFCVSLFGFAAGRVGEHQQNHLLLQTIKDHSSAPQIASFGCLEPSWVYYGGRTIREFGDIEQTAEFLHDSEDHFVITTDHHAEQLQLYLSEDIVVLVDVPYFLKKNRLLVLGQIAEPSVIRMAQEGGFELR